MPLERRAARGMADATAKHRWKHQTQRLPIPSLLIASQTFRYTAKRGPASFTERAGAQRLPSPRSGARRLGGVQGPRVLVELHIRQPFSGRAIAPNTNPALRQRGHDDEVEYGCAVVGWLKSLDEGRARAPARIPPRAAWRGLRKAMRQQTISPRRRLVRPHPLVACEVPIDSVLTARTCALPR